MNTMMQSVLGFRVSMMVRGMVMSMMTLVTCRQQDSYSHADKASPGGSSVYMPGLGRAP